MGVLNGERFFTRTEQSCTFGSHGRVKFEIKSGFIYLQDNPTSTIKYTVFDMKNITKYKWEAWLQMEKSVKKLRILFTLT